MPARPSVRSTTDDRLVEIAGALEAAHHAEPGTGPSLVRVRDLDTSEAEVAVLPVPPMGLVDALIGSTTPAGWEVGVVTEGMASELSPQGVVRGTERVGVRAVVLCHRGGQVASVLRREGGAPIHDVADAGGGPVGRVVDALRRSLGLPTPPPAGSVGLLVAQVWLHRVLGLALHGSPVDEDVVDSVRPIPPRTWSDLREQCAAGAWGELGCRPSDAAWMDDGMFSRWCQAGFAEPAEVLLDLCEVLPGGSARHLAREVAAMAAGDRSGRPPGRDDR